MHDYLTVIGMSKDIIMIAMTNLFDLLHLLVVLKTIANQTDGNLRLILWPPTVNCAVLGLEVHMATRVMKFVAYQFLIEILR